ncbi:unnamed protein product [Triticum turgidum subsp. durum]|uniref:Uncharacterized protein n=1 Tax=Triticum turgidum subsp. durum TaxID=4567 RepID=A0A9R1Q7P0_TRITD|nr:unnamed protein product [Triticum turgidum subsp. durum]
MRVSDGLAPSKMHALQCFQSHRAHGGRRVVVGRALPSLEGNKYHMHPSLISASLTGSEIDLASANMRVVVLSLSREARKNHGSRLGLSTSESPLVVHVPISVQGGATRSNRNEITWQLSLVLKIHS